MRDLLEDKMSEVLAKQIQEEIDTEVMWDLLKSIGWTRVNLSRLKDNRHAVDIKMWIEENRTGEVYQRGSRFLFEKEKDAIIFVLKWS